MEHEMIRRKSILFFLIGVLVLIIYETSSMLYQYYKGPVYVLDTYIKSITAKDYNKAYELLAKDTIKGAEGKEEVIRYYTRIYNTENQLIEVNKKGQSNQYALVEYVYAGDKKMQRLEAVKEQGKWYVKFPFKTYEIEVAAPSGVKVIINGRKAESKNAYTYCQKEVLPGFATVQIEFVDSIYKNIYKVIKVPEVTKITVPCKAGDLEISGVNGFQIDLGMQSRLAEENTVCFENMLAGNYQLQIKHPQGIFEPITEKVTLTEGTKKIKAEQMVLSDKGKKKLKTFLKAFYNAYLEDIKSHKVYAVSTYLGAGNKKEISNYFKEWFIDKKDVQDAEIKISPVYIGLNQEGELVCDVKEEVELVNKEYDSYKEANVARVYRLNLTWQLAVDVREEAWCITKKQIKESVIAYKDDEGQWIEY